MKQCSIMWHGAWNGLADMETHLNQIKLVTRQQCHCISYLITKWWVPIHNLMDTARERLEIKTTYTKQHEKAHAITRKAHAHAC